MGIVTEEQELRCAACGETSAQTVVTEFDADTSVPDLDMRPDGEHRSYIKYWVSKCPHCGYCNAAIDIPVSFTKEYLASDRYNCFDDGLAGRFRKMALVCEKNKVYAEAVKACLYAAWVNDDLGDAEQACECRKAAVKVYDSHRAEFANDPDMTLLLADIMRRSGSFDRVVREYKGRQLGSELITVIAAFEAELAEKGDDKCHKADEVPGVTVI